MDHAHSREAPPHPLKIPPIHREAPPSSQATPIHQRGPTPSARRPHPFIIEPHPPHGPRPPTRRPRPPHNHAHLQRPLPQPRPPPASPPASTHPMQLPIEATGVAHGLAIRIAAPERRVGRVAVGAAEASAAGGALWAGPREVTPLGQAPTGQCTVGPLPEAAGLAWVCLCRECGAHPSPAVSLLLFAQARCPALSCCRPMITAGHTSPDTAIRPQTTPGKDPGDQT